MIAKVFVPARCRRANVHCAVMYHLPGYGGFATPWAELGDFVQLSVSAPALAMAHVLLDTRFTGGHDHGYNYFTDSQNNGPWNSALTTEFIPYLEARLGVGGSAQSRFLEGYSSGAWAAVWLQVSNPDFFQAVWAVAPDPLDFRHFYQVDVTPGSTANFYRQRNGALRPLDRTDDITLKHLMQHVDDDPSEGGLISSYEFAWSPRGDDGLPLRLFDRSDGTLNEATLEAWRAYDVHAVLSDGAAALRDLLAGKLHIYCGTEDTFFYDEPTASLCGFLRRNRYRAVCVLLSGETHGSILGSSSLDPSGLEHLIVTQASAIWRRHAAHASPSRPRRSG